MPSRKRNKGKERKAKKEAIAAKNDDRLDNTWRGWALGEDVLSSDEKIIHCDHGCDLTAPIPGYSLYSGYSLAIPFVIS